ncbi:MAG: hypothetical protein ACREJO_13570 [Phycisphaerales bacterium]
MTRELRMLFVLIVGVAAAALLWRGGSLAVASTRVKDDRQRLIVLEHQAQEVLDLRAKRPTTGMGPRPADDLATLLGSVMKAAGLAESKLRTVAPDGETRLAVDPLWPGVNRRRQSARVGLEPLTLGELGVFLQRWRASQSVWNVTSIDFARISAAGTGEQSYRVNLSLVATYVDGPKKPLP